MEAMKADEFTFRGNGGLRIAGWRWLQDDPSAPVVVFAHGYTSYAVAYQDFLDFLIAQGFSVYAIDHRGHGHSEGVRASLDRFDDLVDDFQRTVHYAKSMHPDARVFSCGHSMGGLLVFRHAFLAPDDLDGVISMSPALVVGIEMSDLKRNLLVRISRWFPELAVIPFEAPPEESDDPFEPEPQADLFAYTGKTRLNLAREMDWAGRDALERAHEITVPILLQHGEADPVTLSSGSIDAYADISSRDKTLEIWPGRPHGLPYEQQWEDVADAAMNWLRARS